MTRVEFQGPRSDAVEFKRLLEAQGIEILIKESLPGGGFEKRGGTGQATEQLIHELMTLGWDAAKGAAVYAGKQTMKAAIEVVKKAIGTRSGDRTKIEILDDDEVDRTTDS